MDLIHALFCQIAEHNGKPPIPPQTMAALLELTMEEMREVPCIISDVSLVKAFEKMVKPDDTGVNFENKVMQVVRVVTARTNHAAIEVEKLRAGFMELHELSKGSAASLFTFFMDLLPEEQRGQYSQAMWNVMVMKCPQQTTVIPVEHFINCFRDSMDTTDTADTILPILHKHIALAKDPAAAAAAVAAATQKKPQGPPPEVQQAHGLMALVSARGRTPHHRSIIAAAQRMPTPHFPRIHPLASLFCARRCRPIVLLFCSRPLQARRVREREKKGKRDAQRERERKKRERERKERKSLARRLT